MANLDGCGGGLATWNKKWSIQLCGGCPENRKKPPNNSICSSLSCGIYGYSIQVELKKICIFSGQDIETMYH